MGGHEFAASGPNAAIKWSRTISKASLECTPDVSLLKSMDLRNASSSKGGSMSTPDVKNLCMIEAYIASSTALLRSILLMSLIRLYRVNDISLSFESFFSSLIEEEDEESISSLNFSKTDSIAASKLCGSVDNMYSSISPCGDVGVAGAKEDDLFSSSPSLLDAETAFVFALLL